MDHNGESAGPLQPNAGKTKFPLSRREMIAALGAAGTTLALQALLGRDAPLGGGRSVAAAVYGGSGSDPNAAFHLDWLNMRDFGAVGDDAADDTGAFQQVLGQALTGGGIVAYVPKGVYRLTAMLRIYRNTKLILHPEAVIKRCHNDSFLINGEAGANYDAYDGHGHITIDGGTWDGNILQFPDAYVGINIAHARNVTLRNMTVKDVVWAHAVEINASRDVSVEHCRFLGYKNAADGSRYFSEAIQIDVPTPLSFAGFGKYDGTPCCNVTVRDCYFGASGTAGTAAWACGVGTHGAIHDVWTSNVKIVGNTFENLTYWAIRLFKWNDCLVEGNTILNCGGGITVSTPAPSSESTKDKDGVQRVTPQAGKGIRIGNNFISGAAAYGGIGCYGDKDAPVKDVTITGNLIYDTGADKHAIAASWCQTAMIERNIVYNARRGVYLDNTANCEVSGNRVDGITVNGIESAKSSGVHIEGNHVKNCGFYGISVSETVRFSLHHNMVEAASLSEHNRYDGIIVSSKNDGGSVHSNMVRKADNGNQNRYGLQIAASSLHIDTYQNILEGVSGAYLNASATSSDRLLLYNSAGACYKVTVDGSGNLAASPL